MKSFLKSDERNRARVFPSSQEISQIQCIISIWDLGQIKSEEEKTRHVQKLVTYEKSTFLSYPHKTL